ncbi:MAG TPA: prepilin-type N-terminal cleavage/methylation domain-containing protein [Verrucomicrobiae bacterium]|nr:prepilin-type N-terminal cleavage/methylation domain-containing protein [Verrucomicrobiae bacterium]
MRAPYQKSDGAAPAASRRNSAANALLPRSFKRPFVVRHPSLTSAFTLIEIMIVVAIMAIILAAGIPSLYGFFHKGGLRKTTNDIVETCQSARASAILNGSPTELIFHPRDGTCETVSASGGYGSWAHSAKIENCSIEMLDVNLQECKEFDTVKVRFFPNGTCDEMTLVLRSDNNEWRKISLEITTALPSVSDHIQ